MSSNLLAKYYQKNKDNKKLLTVIKIYLQKGKKINNLAVKVTKISKKMKKSFVEYKNKYYRMRKNVLLYIRNYYFTDLESSYDEEYKDVLKNQFLSYTFTLKS